MSDKESRISIVNLSNYVQPEIKEVPSRKYVTYGEKNNYFQYLIDRSRGSATNGAVIKSIIDLIHGEGLNEEDFYNIIPEADIQRLENDLKSMGQSAIQLQYFGGRKSVKGSHIPVESLAAEKADEKGVINAYYHSKDWSKVRSISDLERIPTFESKEKGGIEILYIKPYNSGLFYYSTVDYQGGLQYAELEEEIGNYHVNNIQNGLTPSMLINMNNGVPDEEKQKKIEQKIIKKYGGSSNAGRFILSFNDNKDAAATIDAVPLSDAAEQYQFLSDESMKKILVSHRVTSPLLLGLSTSTGFGSNADELKVASVLFETLVIKPFRKLLIQAFTKLDKFNGIERDLEFISLNPFMDDEEVTKEVTETTEETTEDAETVVDNENTELSAHQDDSLIANALIGLGEDEDLENWELIDSSEVDYKNESYLDGLIDELNSLNQPKESFLSKVYNFVTTGTARPNAKSEQDGENSQGVKFKVRYQYAPLAAGENSRDFCKRMVTASKIYRKEDIIAMENQSVNPGWGLGGANNYSIWLYKGGGGCHHKWFRKTYVQRTDTKIDIKSPLAPTISTTKARQEGFRAPENDSKVSVAPVNMPNKGFVNK